MANDENEPSHLDEINEDLRAIERRQHNLLEQSKVSANFWNGLAVNVMTLGVIAPAVAIFLGIDGGKYSTFGVGAAIVICGVGSLLLHWFAEDALKNGLSDD